MCFCCYLTLTSHVKQAALSRIQQQNLYWLNEATYIVDGLDDPSGNTNSVYTATRIFMNANVGLSTLTAT